MSSNQSLLKNSLNDIINTITESEFDLVTQFNIIDKNTNSGLKSTSKSNLVGGYSESENDNLSATSTARASMVGSKNNLSATSEVDFTENVNNDSATSSFSNSQRNMNNYYSATSSINANPNNNNYSATSSIKNGAQLGGNYSATSAASTNSVKDINKLLSMLTSESEEPATQNNAKDALSNTSTQTLENQLRDILKQDGGSKKHRQSGGSNVNVADIKSFFTTLKSQGVKVDLKLNNKSMSDYFNENSTTTDLNNQDGGAKRKSKKSKSKTNKVVVSSSESDSPTNDSNISTVYEPNSEQNGGSNDGCGVKLKKENEEPIELDGGAKKKGSAKSKKGSAKTKKGSAKTKKGSKKINGGMNPGFQAFLDLKKFIATKLGVSNGPNVGAVAGAVQREVKEKNPGMDAVKVAAEGKKHFEKNMEHFKQMLKK